MAARHRFPRTMRLGPRREYDPLFNTGAKLVNRQLVLWLRPAPGGTSRLGLSVSRKVGGAVQRNRVKRCLREAFRRLAPDLPAPVEVIALARPARPPTTLAEAQSSLAHLLGKWARRNAPPDARADRP